MRPDPFPGLPARRAALPSDQPRPLPFDHPTLRGAEIVPNSLATRRRIWSEMLEGSPCLRRLAATPALRAVIAEELQPGRPCSREDIGRDIRHRASTVFHPVGTCRMGPDPKHDCGRRAPEGASACRPSRGRRVDLSGGHVGQHQCADHHGGRKGALCLRCDMMTICARVAPVAKVRTMDDALFTDDFKLTPYWWDRVPRPQLPDTPLPQKPTSSSSARATPA